MTTNSHNKLGYDFFRRDVLEVAPEILGKYLNVREINGNVSCLLINEVEAYRGVEDLACHASKGRTSRTDPMYGNGGILYIYLVYGIHWMLNIVTASEDNPQAILVRGVGEYNGPGKLTRGLNIESSYNYEDLVTSSRIWIEDRGGVVKVNRSPRIGVDYAGVYWSSRNWRFFTNNHQ